MKPKDVVSPRANWQLIDVLWDGTHQGTPWSIALGRWLNETGWRPVMAMRWDGPDDGKGMPISTGYAVWFVVPDELYTALIGTPFVPTEKKQLAIAILGLKQI